MHTTYLNHAGASWPKPAAVLQATEDFSRLEPLDWPRVFAASQQTVADFFHVAPQRLLLTPCCTTALQLAVADHDWRRGDRVLSSRYEHHALQRSLAKLTDLGVQVQALPSGAHSLVDLNALEAELGAGKVRLLACTAACNVTGELLPISQMIEVAHHYGALVLIDGAQIAGWWDLDLEELGADMFTFAGQKGLQAPWGIGGLYVSPRVAMQCPSATCDVPPPGEAPTCAVMPGYCDAGSVNQTALAGLAAACAWLNEPAQQDRLSRARKCASDLAQRLRKLAGVTLHGDAVWDNKVPTVAATFQGVSSMELAARLRSRGVIAAGGLHCAPAAHAALGTDQQGLLRFSFGPQPPEADLEELLAHLQAAWRQDR